MLSNFKSKGELYTIKDLQTFNWPIESSHMLSCYPQKLFNSQV